MRSVMALTINQGQQASSTGYKQGCSLIFVIRTVCVVVQAWLTRARRRWQLRIRVPAQARLRAKPIT